MIVIIKLAKCFESKIIFIDDLLRFATDCEKTYI